MTTVALIFAAFVIGFLLGDRRGVKQANEILDHNMQVLLTAIHGEPAVPVEDEEGERRSTLH